MRKKGSSLVLHSFRTDPSLHDMSSLTTNLDQTQDKPNQQTANTNPVQTQDKPNQQTANTNPAQITIKPNQLTTNPTSAASEPKVEIELLNGRKLRVNANIDLDILTRLIAVLDK